MNIEPVFHFADASKQHPGAQTLGLYRDLIREELGEMDIATAYGQTVGVLDGGLDLIWVIVGYLKAYGFTAEQIEAGWQEVARSNLSKIDPLSGAVIKRPDGKVLKPCTYSPPDLATVLGRA